MTSFGIALAELREAVGMSQRDIARSLGVSAATVSRWESGQRLPRAAHLLELAHLCRVKPGHLMDQIAGVEPERRPTSTSPVDVELLARAFELVRSQLGVRFSSLTGTEFAKLVKYASGRGEVLADGELLTILELLR